MGAILGRVIDDYRGLVETCQQRAGELGISRLEIDWLAGLTSGYSGKLLGNDDSKKQKRMWPIGLEAILGVLGLRIILIEDQAATARTLSLRTPVTHTHQRFGNKYNSKRSLNIDSAETIKIAAPQRTEPPVSRAHLRVIQNKRGSRFG
jgi:hypothetical protein